MADFDRESMLEIFLFEMNQLVDQLEQILIESESGFSMDIVNEIFRIMHTVKGSAAMMLFNTISTATHAAEDLFYYLREENPQGVDYSELTDNVLACMDFIKAELEKIANKQPDDGDPQQIVEQMHKFLAVLKGETIKDVKATQEPAISALSVDVPVPSFSGEHKYRAVIYFDEDAEMENIRAFTVLNNINPHAINVMHEPSDIINPASIESIRENGFILTFSSNSSYHDIFDILNKTVHIRDIVLDELTGGNSSLDGLNTFDILLRFEDNTEMVNVRAFTIIHNLKPLAEYILYTPENLMDEASIPTVFEHGLKVELVTSSTYDEIHGILANTVYLKELVITDRQLQEQEETAALSNTIEATKQTQTKKQEQTVKTEAAKQTEPTVAKKPAGQALISINVSKLDQLLKFMGELVIAEAMVTQNPELEGLNLENFHKEARQLKKIIKDVQETVMGMRMMPLANTFLKMNRIVRDMCKTLGKEATLDIVGENTEVDKNIIEHIGDPLMHIIRNSLDHGIETPEKRRAKGKLERGNVLLEARNSGSEVWIIIKDDGAGLNKDRIMEKAKNNGMLKKHESEYTDKEIFQFIFMPGFSTNAEVTSYSGRGVGMDVVNKNLEVVGGTVTIDSEPGYGSTFILKIPLTLAIIEGMLISMGNAKYTIPIVSIRDSFRAKQDSVFMDPNGNEMITVRGEHYNIVRLYELFGLDGEYKSVEEGIMMIIENGDSSICLLVDELIGEQQVVVKSIPKYIKKIRGISGCTLLGNGDISLIIDVAGFFDK